MFAKKTPPPRKFQKTQKYPKITKKHRNTLKLNEIILTDPKIDLSFGTGLAYTKNKINYYFFCGYNSSRKIDGSIRASQILISYNSSANQNLNINRSKDEAKKLANDLFFKIRRNPKSFSNYVQEFSDGAGKSTLGDIGFFQEKIIT